VTQTAAAGILRIAGFGSRSPLPLDARIAARTADPLHPNALEEGGRIGHRIHWCWVKGHAENDHHNPL
jgi:hypothetical protein